MKRLILPVALIITASGLLPQSATLKRRMPDGRTQAEVILEADYKNSLKDAAELVKLSKELKEEIEKNQQHVLSVKSVRTVERIEKLAKRIKRRMKRI